MIWSQPVQPALRTRRPTNPPLVFYCTSLTNSKKTLVALDFVTGLPPSHGNTTILTIVGRFSKSVHLLPLPKLPSAEETASLLISNVFKLHGLPMEVVSDGVPSFPLTSGEPFLSCLGQVLTFLLVSIHRLMDRQSEQTSSLR